MNQTLNKLYNVQLHFQTNLFPHVKEELGNLTKLQQKFIEVLEISQIDSDDGVSRLIQSLSSYYVRYINQTYDRTGTLWEGRYKSCLVDSDDYFLLVSRYIELNPIRAKMVKHPSEYPWSSFYANAMGVAIKFVTPHYCYKSLGISKKIRQENYLSLFDAHIPEFTLEEINDSVMKGWTLGSLKFIKQIKNKLVNAIVRWHEVVIESQKNIWIIR